MNILFYNFYDDLNLNNTLFTQKNTSIGDNLLDPFNYFNKICKDKNINVGTNAKIKLENADIVFFNDIPNFENKYVREIFNQNIPKYLIIFESQIIRKLDQKNSLFNRFDKIFTYDDNLIDNKRFFKINYSFDFNRKINNYALRNNKYVMISSNKSSNKPNELYSKRRKIIDWFENNYPERFSLYGHDWDKYIFPNIIPLKYLNRYKFIQILLRKKLNVYKGQVERKNKILLKYKFCFCFENVSSINGYITEKIFDSFFSLCIPIYLGAPNISSHIPTNCFIDASKFTSLDELFLFCENLDDNEINLYVTNIINYLNSPEARKFSVEKFSETLLNHIKN